MTTTDRLTKHQAEVLRDARRWLVRENPQRRYAVMGVRRKSAPYALVHEGDVSFYVMGVYVGSAGALAHLADKGYLAPITLHSRRSTVTGYRATEKTLRYFANIDKVRAELDAALADKAVGR